MVTENVTKTCYDLQINISNGSQYMDFFIYLPSIYKFTNYVSDALLHFGTGAKITLQPEQISIVIVAANLFLSWTSVKFDCNRTNIQSLKRRSKRNRRSRHLVPSLDETGCKKHRNFNSNTELHGCGFYD